mgnify:CR=1 FL=1
MSIFPPPLIIHTYQRLSSAQLIALAGTGLTTVALGIALALKMIAYALIAPLFGAVAQKLPRRTLLVTLDILRACGVALCH